MRRHVDLTMDGATYRLTPNPAALLRVSEEIADPYRLLSEAGVNARLGMGPPAHRVMRVLWIALCENGHPMTFEAARDMLFGLPLIALWDPYTLFLAGLCNSGDVPDDDDLKRQLGLEKAAAAGAAPPAPSEADPGNLAARRATRGRRAGKGKRAAGSRRSTGGAS